MAKYSIDIFGPGVEAKVGLVKDEDEKNELLDLVEEDEFNAFTEGLDGYCNIVNSISPDMNEEINFVVTNLETDEEVYNSKMRHPNVIYDSVPFYNRDDLEKHGCEEDDLISAMMLRYKSVGYTYEFELNDDEKFDINNLYFFVKNLDEVFRMGDIFLIDEVYYVKEDEIKNRMKKSFDYLDEEDIEEDYVYELSGDPELAYELFNASEKLKLDDIDMSETNDSYVFLIDGNFTSLN